MLRSNQMKVVRSTKYTAIALIILSSLSSLISAQALAKIEPCRVTTDSLPKIRGLYLGMPFRETRALISNLYTRPPEKYGIRLGLVNSIPLPQFSDVESLTLTFLDDLIYKIHIRYKLGTTSLKSLEDYTAELSDSLRIPERGWSYTPGGENGGVAESTCYGFTITAIFVESPKIASLKIESVDLLPTILLRQYEEEKQKKKSKRFKP